MDYKKKAIIISIIAAVFMAIIIVGIGFGIKYLYDRNKIYKLEKKVTNYGTRIKEDKSDKDEIIKEAKEKLSKSNELDKYDIKVVGKIIYVTCYVKSDITIEDSKNIGNTILDYFSNETLKNYDINYIFKNEYKNNEFVIMGYKNTKSDYIIW